MGRAIGAPLDDVGVEPSLERDLDLPFLDIARWPERMLAFLNNEVVQAAGLAPVTALEQRRLDYTPGRKCSALYSLAFAGGLAEERRWVVVTFGKNGRLGEVYDRHHGRGSEGPGLDPVVYLPEYQCLVELFPADWQLPFLAAATNPEEVAGLVARSVDGECGLGVRRPEIEILRYRPHETCVLEYRFGSAQGGVQRKLVGKLYREPATAENVWGALTVLHSQAPSEVSTPRPLAIEKEWGLIIMERVPGTPMRHLIEGAGAQEQLQATRRAAAALADYHSCHLRDGEVRSITHDLAKLRKRLARLRLVAPWLAQRIDGLLRRVESRASRFAVSTPSLIHGDFKPSQILIEDGRVGIVDLDNAGPGDPAIDVGNLMAQLRGAALATRQSHLRQLASYFLSEYQRHSPTKIAEDRASLFQALSLVRMAVRSFEHSPWSYDRKGGSSKQVMLLDEAASCLSLL